MMLRKRTDSGDQRAPYERTNADHYVPPERSPAEYPRRRGSTVEDEVDNDRSGLKEIQDEQERGYSRKPPLRPLSPTTERKPTTSIEVQSESNGLVLGDNISYSFICSLLDDEGRPCERQFSGVTDSPPRSQVTQLICRPNASTTSNNTFRRSIKIFSVELLIPSTEEEDLSLPPPPPKETHHGHHGIRKTQSRD
jgi:hypothetical protein